MKTLNYNYFGIIALTTILFCFSCSQNQSLTVENSRQMVAGIKSALFIPDPLPNLDLNTHGSIEANNNVLIEKVTYSSQFGLRIPAVIYRPKDSMENMPGIVIINGHGGDKYAWYSFYAGMLYAQAGAVVVTFDPIGEGERHINRKSGTRAHDTRLEPREIAQRMGGLLITDVMQAVSYLAHRKDIDSNRIVIMGYSLGSFLASIAGAVDPRIHACVLAGGGNIDGPDGYWDNSKPMCQGIPYQSLQFLGDRPASIYALHAQRGPTLLYNGLADSVVNMHETGEAHLKNVRQRTIKLLGTSKDVFEARYEPDVSHRPFFITKNVALWLEEKIDFPYWTKSSIDHMGETHISEWAAKHHVEMDRLYATESREGGVRALGTNIPGLSREKLTVFAPSQWEIEKDNLIYESWLERVKDVIN
jgi:dienelactone hydrolase